MKKILFPLFLMLLFNACADGPPEVGRGAQAMTAEECERDPEGCFNWLSSTAQTTYPSGWPSWEEMNDIIESGEKPPFGDRWVRRCRTCENSSGDTCSVSCCLIVYGYANDLSYCESLTPVSGQPGCAPHEAQCDYDFTYIE